MNRIIFSLVSYFVCLLFFVGTTQAATFNVTSTTNDPSAVNGLGWAVTQANAAGVGPHTIVLQVDGATWGVGVTLSNNNVTVMAAPSGCDATRVINMGGANFTVSGNNCVFSGLIFRGTCLLLSGSNNRVFGCWFNTDATGLASNGVGTNNGSMVYINGGANNIVGLATQCRNVFSGASTSDMIRVDGTATGTIISNNYMGVGKDGTTLLGAASQNGVNFVSGSMTSSRIDSNIIASTASDGIKIGGDFSSSFIRKNTIKLSSAGNGILAPATSTTSNVTISGNTANSNNLNGIYILGTANNLQVLNNNLGATTAGLAGPSLGNIDAGLRVEANTTSLTISNNVVLANGSANDLASSSGIYVYANSVNMSNVTISNNRVGIDVNDTKSGNIFSGIYLEGTSGAVNNFTSVTVSGNIVGDNGSNQPTKKSHGISFLNIGPATATNLQVLNNYIGVTPTTDPIPNANVGNHGNGIEFASTIGFTASGNVIGFNKFETTITGGWTGAGIEIDAASSVGTIQNNYIGVTAAGVNIGNTNPSNSVYPNQMAGITLEQANNISILSNTIKNNNWGIELTNVGATLSTSNTIEGNTISNQTSYGIYIPGGSGNIIGGGSSATANTITANGADGIYLFNTTSLNNKISQNKISCNTGQGIKLNYGASQGNSGQQPPVITAVSATVVSGTATAGATIELFTDDPTCQIACGSAVTDNRREGKTYLGTVTATGGVWSYTGTIDVNNISATATVGSNTSEFSTCNILTICPPNANAGSNQTLCNVTTATLAGNDVSAAGGTGAWTTISGTGVATTPSSPTSGVTGLTVGAATVFQWAVNASGCSQTTSTVTITVSAPSQSNAGTTQNLCNVTTTNLNATTTVGTGVWSLTSGTGTITTPSSATSGVTGLGVGANVFKWTVTNGACAAATSTVTVNVSAPSQSNAGTAQNLCNVTTTNLNATTTVGTGTWTLTSGSGTITTPSSPTSGVTGLGVGANVFTWTVTNGACTAATSTVTVTVSAPSQSNAGTTQNLCNVTTTNLNATTTVGTGVWSLTSGTGTITTPSSATSGVTGLGVGANVFKWTVTNGACAAATSTVTVNVSAPSQSNAGTAQNLCNVTTTNLNATTTVGTGTWTLTSGSGTITTPSSPTSGVTGLGIGANVFTWSVTNGACAAATSTVTVTVSVPSQSNAGTTQNLCNVTTTNLNATTTVGTGVWSLTSGTGTITTPSSATSGVTGLGVGANVFKWTVTNGACAAATSTVTVNVSAPSQSNAGTAQNLCNVTTTNLNATTTVGTGTWTLTSGSGTITTPSSPTSGVTGLGIGANVFTWSVTNGACAAATSTVTVTVSAPSQSNAGTDQNLCNVTTANLNATTTVGTGAWTLTSGSGTVTTPSSPTSGVTGLAVGTNSFTWTVTNGACAAATSNVNIIISAPSQSNAGSSQTVCNTTTGNLNANTTVSAGVWTGPVGVTITNPNSPNTGVSGLTVGTNTFTWTVTNGVCASVFSTTTIIVDAPSSANAGSDQSLCNVTTASLTAGTSVGTGVWTGPVGVTINTPGSSTTTVSGLAVGANTFTWTVTNGVCAAAIATTTITVSAPGTTSAGPAQNLCNVTTTSLSGSGTTGNWTTVSGSGVVTSPTNPTSGVTGLTVGTSSTFQWTVTSGACSGSAQVTVTVSAPPVGAAGSDLNLCNVTTATLSATGGGTWSTLSGTGIVTTPTNANSGVTGLTVGGTSVFKWTVVNGACTATSNLSVTSSSPASSNAGNDQTLCNVTTATLSATGTGTWSTSLGTGVATSLNNPSSGVTGLTPGQTTVFEWTVTNGNCTATSIVHINSSAPVTADPGPAQSLCNTTTATLAGVGTGTWTATALSPGTGTVTDITNNNSGVTGLTIGASSTFTWTVTNGACSNAANVTLTVSAGTTPDAGSGGILCNAASTTLGATGVGTWSITSGAGTITTPSDPHTAVTVTTSPATFTWTINGGGCGSLSADVIFTTVALAKPIVNSSALGACSGSTNTFNVTNIDGAATYAWTKSSPGSSINLHAPTNGTSVDVDGTSSDYVVVTVSKGGCSDTTRAGLLVYPNPPAGGTFSETTCADSLVLKTALFNSSFYTGTWTSSYGGITFDPTTDSTFTLKNFIDGAATVTYTITGSCGTATYTFNLQIGGEFLSAKLLGPSDTACITNSRELVMKVTPAPDNNHTYTYVWVSHLNFDHPVINSSSHIDTTKVPYYTVNPEAAKNIYLGYVFDKNTGCKAAIDTAKVYASEGQDLNVPNLITPNGDNENDHWVLRDKVTHQDILPGSQFDLYNRWGERVFTMGNYDNRFNASGISDGIYFFNLKAGCGGKEYKGWLQILGNTNP